VANVLPVFGDALLGGAKEHAAASLRQYDRPISVMAQKIIADWLKANGFLK
jgi:hypothetical protein